MNPTIRPDYHPVVFHDTTTAMNHGPMLAQRPLRTQIDIAVGVLIALRRCSEQQGFQCLADAVQATGVGLAGVSHALITLARGDTDTHADPTALNHWRHAITQWPHAEAVSAW